MWKNATSSFPRKRESRKVRQDGETVPTKLTKSSGILAILAAMSVVSCSGGGEEETLPPIGSIIGVWQITESGTLSDPRCAPPANPYILYVAQNGSLVIAQTGFSTTNTTLGSNGAQFSGTLNGSTLAIQGGNPAAAAGSTLQTARVATVVGGCDALITGTRTMLYTEPGFSCSGVLSFTGTRTLGSGCAGTLAATAVPESSMAHNTAATAQAITRPAEVSGTISSGMAEDDWYSFTLTQNAVVTILLNGPAAPQDIHLFLRDDGDLNTLASSTSASSREAVANTLGAGTYRIRVTSNVVTGTASYTLLIQ